MAWAFGPMANRGGIYGLGIGWFGRWRMVAESLLLHHQHLPSNKVPEAATRSVKISLALAAARPPSFALTQQ